VFTIDDGYLDQAWVGLEVFAEYDCPATVFVTTDFLDGALWFWWDRIEYVLETTRRRALPADPAVGVPACRWADDQQRARVQADLIRGCKLLPDADKHTRIEALAAAAEVELPAAPPARYAPVAWDTVRAFERRGMRFGPHTRTHPILARTPEGAVEEEIAGSWRRLRGQTGRPAPVFCYPNGQVGDFGPREYDVLGRAGLLAAVTGTPGYADRRLTLPEERWRVPRFAYMDDLAYNIQYVAGLERLKELIRGHV
jgi:peptidoglycan/xylan/chitin deacetylase (PgdA/CDA1 family)